MSSIESIRSCHPCVHSACCHSSVRARLLSVALSSLLLGFFTLALLLLPLHFVSYAEAKAFFDSYVAVHGAQSNVRAETGVL